MSKNNRVIVNPVNGEIVTFLKTTEETKGEYILVELDLAPGGGVPMHFHMNIVEEIRVLQGVLNVCIDKKESILTLGEEVKIIPPQNHRFWNASDESIKLLIRQSPAGDFEKAMRIADGLAADGKSTANGMPRNFLHLCLSFMWTGSFLSGVPAIVQKIVFYPFAWLAIGLGVDKKLEKRYL